MIILFLNFIVAYFIAMMKTFEGMRQGSLELGTKASFGALPFQNRVRPTYRCPYIKSLNTIN